jgi:2-methylcitrate dehydratase PrpD
VTAPAHFPPRLPADQQHVLAALNELAAWSSRLHWEDVPPAVQERLRLVLLDSLAVTLAAGRLPERRPLVAAWDPAPGSCPVLGSGVLTGPETAAWLNATAMVALELDEGNKHAAGHPAAHGFPAVLALATHVQADGPTTAAALLVAYEVAARFGRACRLRPGMHPHGSWGTAGGAAGCARLLGLDAAATTAAIDAASGMPVAGHFAAALDGNPVRNEWMGVTALVGISAARLAQAGVAHATGIAARSLGELLGTFRPDELTAELGRRWDVQLGYFKQHASCAFTHPAADAVLRLRGGLALDEVEEVVVEVPTMAAQLHGQHGTTRLGAMFSLPFVTATALAHGVVEPGSYTPDRLADPQLAALAGRVRVVASAELDRRLPAERGARVAVRSRGGREVRCAVTNAVGDADHLPYDETGLVALLGALLAPGDALDRVRRCVRELPEAPSVRPVLARLAAP